MIVSVDNGKGHKLVCDVIGVDSEFTINSLFVTNKGDQYLQDKSLLYTANEYTGPQFDSLDE